MTSTHEAGARLIEEARETVKRFRACFPEGRCVLEDITEYAAKLHAEAERLNARTMEGQG